MKNQQNNTFLYILNISLRLVAVCAVIALLVATVNYFAAPVIEKNEEIATQNAISMLFDGKTVVTEQLDIVPEHMLGTVDAVYSVSDDGGILLGYCVTLSPSCFKGEVDLITAFDTAAFIKGVEITSTNDETTGIGTKVKDKSFTDKFIESSDSPAATDISNYIIARATKTSKPVTESVFLAKELISEFLSNNSDKEASAE